MQKYTVENKVAEHRPDRGGNANVKNVNCSHFLEVV